MIPFLHRLNQFGDGVLEIVVILALDGIDARSRRMEATDSEDPFSAEPSSLAIGDMVQFQKNGIPIVHRIIDKRNIDGTFWFMTKGDSNDIPDPDLISQNHINGKVAFTIPKIGWLTIGINEITSAIGNFMTNIPFILSNLVSWLTSQGLVVVSIIALAAFSGLSFVTWKDRRRLNNE